MNDRYKSLTDRQKALLRYAGKPANLSLEGQWVKDAKAISDALVESTDAIRALITELEESGYFDKPKSNYPNRFSEDGCSNMGQ